MTETVFTLLGQPVTGFGLGMAGAMLLMLAVMGGWCHARKQDDGVFIRFAALAVPLGAGLSIEARAENLANARVEAGISGADIVERGTPRTLWLGLRYGAR